MYAYITSLVPVIEKPKKELIFIEKLLWSFTGLVVILIFYQTPLYGIKTINNINSFEWLRTIFASNRGSLMELGISPIITSSLISELTLQVCTNVGFQQNTRAYQSIKKILGFIIILFQASLHVFKEAHNRFVEIDVKTSILVIIQLVVAGFLTILIDEMLQSGYGIGNGLSLFTITNFCETVIWYGFSPIIKNSYNDAHFEGVLVSTFYLLSNETSRLYLHLLFNTFSHYNFYFKSTFLFS